MHLARQSLCLRDEMGSIPFIGDLVIISVLGMSGNAASC